MPYIEKSERPKVDSLVSPLITYLQSLPVEKQDGTVNYAVTKIVKHLYPQKYFHLNRALGVLTAITHELYRKIVGPYEDTKISQNGEVE
ncbi:hypothetical protein HYW55_04055 [Candidatus Gottesmanbacteria bacterium]|nr:hypothetical protein [Candidatus Gottesmanbacteria bacterium]